MPDQSDKPARSLASNSPARAAGAKSALWWTMADTTWRMLAPSVVLVGAGIFADVRLATKPWLTIAGVVLGLVASGFLIRQQLEVTR